MFRVARDNPNPRGRRGRVWTRFPTALDEILEEENVRVEASEVGETGDREASPHILPQIIITPPTPEMSWPAEWPPSGPAQQGTEHSLWPSTTEVDWQLPEQPGTSHISVSAHSSGATPAKFRSDEADFEASGGRSSHNKPSHLSLTKANKFINKIILGGANSWEFRWMPPGENARSLGLGWSKLVPQGYIQISRRSHHATRSGSSPSAAEAVSRKHTQQSSRSFEHDRDHMKERREKMPKHLEALSRPWASQGRWTNTKSETGHMSELGHEIGDMPRGSVISPREDVDEFEEAWFEYDSESDTDSDETVRQYLA